MGEFFAERCLDELFLTLSPQVAGRENSLERFGIVAEKSLHLIILFGEDSFQ